MQRHRRTHTIPTSLLLSVAVAAFAGLDERQIR